MRAFLRRLVVLDSCRRPRHVDTRSLARSLMCLLSSRGAGRCSASIARALAPARLRVLTLVVDAPRHVDTMRSLMCFLSGRGSGRRRSASIGARSCSIRLVLCLDSCRQTRHHVDMRSLCASFPNNSVFLLVGRIRSSFRERHLNVVNK